MSWYASSEPHLYRANRRGGKHLDWNNKRMQELREIAKANQIPLNKAHLLKLPQSFYEQHLNPYDNANADDGDADSTPSI
jgi:hypothetical protein